MSTLYKKRVYMFCAPLLFSEDYMTVGGSWEDYVRVKDPLGVLDVCSICLGRLNEVSKLSLIHI